MKRTTKSAGEAFDECGSAWNTFIIEVCEAFYIDRLCAALETNLRKVRKWWQN